MAPIYVLGGWVVATWEPSITAYDVAADQWSVKSPLPTQIARRGCVAANGYADLIGGQDLSSPSLSGGLSDRVDVYDPLVETWATATRLPTRAPLSGGRGRWIGSVRARRSDVELQDHGRHRSAGSCQARGRRDSLMGGRRGNFQSRSEDAVGFLPELAAVRERDRDVLPALLVVAQRMDDDRDLVAGLHAGRLPARAR